MTDIANPLIGALDPIVSRVRTDVTAVKKADGSRWTHQALTPERIAAHLNGGPPRGVCPIRAGEDVTLVAVLDFDSHGGEVSWPRMSAVVGEVVDTLELGWGASPILWRSSGGRGVHLYLLWDQPQDAFSVREWLRGVLASCGLRSGARGVQAAEVEIFPKQDAVSADEFGNQFILPLAGASVPLERDELAGLLVPLPREAALAMAWPVCDGVPRRERPVRAAGVAERAPDGPWRTALAALTNTGARELDYDDWFRVVCAIHHETSGSDDGLALAQEWSARSGKHDPAFLETRVWPYVRSADERGGAVVTGGTVMALAARLEHWIGEDRRPNPDDWEAVEDVVGEGDADLSSPAQVERGTIPEAKHLCTDQANANRLVKAYGNRVLVAAGRWHVWDGMRWRADEADVWRWACTLSAMVADEARALLARAKRQSAQDGNAKRVEQALATHEAMMKWAARCESKGTIEAAVSLARKMLTVDPADLDTDPWLLNCRNGVVDLRSGEIRGHDSGDLITKLVDLDYEAGATCERWEQALLEITQSAEVTGFLQRWFGYCATGLVREQAFVVHWGDGANGKSTVLDTMARVLGDYAGTAAPGLLAGGDKERHPTEIAALHGRRMVTAHETRDSVQLREDFVKQATGGDRMVARYMREDFFEFHPTHKLQLLTNHKPSVRGQDYGIWRRVRLVCYSQRFGSVEDVQAGVASVTRDDALQEELGRSSALRGVLAWVVRGAVEWAKGGLRAPSAVVEASERYRYEQDRVAAFLGECCDLGEGGRSGFVSLTEGFGGLYPAYVSWCKDAGVHPVARQRFLPEVQRVCPWVTISDAMSSGSGKRRKVLRITGIRLLPEE